MQDTTTEELTPEPAKVAAAAPSRSGAKALKRDAKKAKLKIPKPSKRQRGTVRQ